MVTVGEKIRLRREELGMSQEELAAKMGYSNRSTIARIENGGNNVNQKKLIAFAKALDCSAGWFLDDNNFRWSEFLNNLIENRDTFYDIEYYLDKAKSEIKKIKETCFNDNFLNILFFDRPEIIEALKTTTANGEITIDGIECKLSDVQIEFIRNAIIMNLEQAKRNAIANKTQK